MAREFIRFKNRGSFAAVIKQLPSALQSSANSILESVVFKNELEDYVGDSGDLISHTTLSDIGTTTHSQLDTHVENTSIHFEEGDIDHTTIQSIGVNTHDQVDTHIASNTGHPNQVVNSTEPADGTLSVNEGVFWYELV